MAVAGLLVAIAIAWFADLGRFSVIPFVVWLVASLPAAIKVQHALVPVYLRMGFKQRALSLATDIRESAPTRKSRDLASVDVAMVQSAMGRFEDALRNLDGVKDESFGALPRALILGNRAWCRAHLSRDLERALDEAGKARLLAPEEGLLKYFEGLVLLKMGKVTQARATISASLELEPDPELPLPGERRLVLGDALFAEDDQQAAKNAWRVAEREARGRDPFATEIKKRLDH